MMENGYNSLVPRPDLPFCTVFRLRQIFSTNRAGIQEKKMSSFNGKPRFDGTGEHFRDGKPCRACTDVKTWLKMTREEKKRKEVKF